MKSNYRIIVAHPAMQHSFHTAVALKSEGLLFKYMTCIYDKKGSCTHFVSKWLKGNLKIKLQAHKSNELNDNEIIQYCELESLFLLMLRRIDKKKKFVNRINTHIIERFNKKIVRYIVKNRIDAVILYDTVALEALERLKKNTNVICVLDMSAPEANYMDQIFTEDSKCWGDKSAPLDFERSTAVYQKRLEEAAREIVLADCFLVASSFSEKSLIVQGVEKNRIFLCSYGIQQDSNVECILRGMDKSDEPHSPLRCVFVGNVNQKKGVYHIFRMLEENDCSDFSFSFIGAYDKNDCYINEMKARCEFTGHITKREVRNKLMQTDVMLFPTLCDGFGFVVLEALCVGVPVICSTNAGACDIIREGINGFVIEPSDVKKMYALLTKLNKDRNMLAQLKKNAIESVNEYTWENYGSQLTFQIRNYLDEKYENNGK